MIWAPVHAFSPPSLASYEFEEENRLSATEALCRIVTRAVGYESLSQEVACKHANFHFLSDVRRQEAQRPIRLQIPKTELACEFSSVRAFGAKAFSHELMFQLFERAMTKDALAVLEAKEVELTTDERI